MKSSCRKLWFLTGLLVVFNSLSFSNYNTGNSEIIYRLKAVYLEKFSIFTDWPDSIHSNENDSPFIISVLGDDPELKEELIKVFYKEKIKILNRSVILDFIENINDLDDPQILFLTNKNNHSLEKLLPAIKEKNILIISDNQGDANKGAHISFYITDDGKLHFEINKTVIKSSNIKLSSKLLRIAKVLD